ncbi:hypothetical protein HYC85_003750 [Camellia sinensis]|uniref:Uncharacterized protein n=1 Tax=Camellia sinensis TaxID=4442 RepID=A0A7J7HVJ9_CAMSI|nr:hypothetical protein HYC85_003750 [Camellia sinensis]
MFQIKPIVVFLLFFFSTLFCFSHGAFDNLQQSIPELMNERDYNEVVELDAQKAGSVFLYIGQAKFTTSIVDVLTFILIQANTTVQKLKDVFNYLLAAKNIGVGKMLLPADLQANIDEIQRQINVIADNLQNVTANSSKDLRNFLDPILMIVGWIAVVGTFILSGMFLLVHNFKPLLNDFNLFGGRLHNLKIKKNSIPNFYPMDWRSTFPVIQGFVRCHTDTRIEPVVVSKLCQR